MNYSSINYNLIRSSIMHLLLITLCSFSVLSNAQPCPPGYTQVCDQVRHTATYNQFYAQFGNKNSRFYDSDTFGIDLASYHGLDSCMSITRDKLINLLTKNMIGCTGVWCGKDMCGTVYKEWGCYEMEHIFDKNGPDFADIPYVKETLANVVMAYGKWNRQVSHTQIGYLSALSEKTIIYDSNQMNRIKQQLIQCHQRQKRDIEQNAPEPLSYSPTPTPSPVVIPITTPLVMINDSATYLNINDFDYEIECVNSCTCNSTRYLDILCDCDYSETGFDPSDCPDQSVVEYRKSDTKGYVITIVIMVLIIIGLVIALLYISRDHLKVLYTRISMT